MEKWYKIIGFKDVEDVYEINDKGNVRKGDKFLKQTPNKRGGYFCVTLYSSKSQNGYFTMIHSLMKYYIFGITDPEVMINHKDGNKQNNDLSNLEISNALHNTHHAIDSGLFNASKITDEMISSVREYVLNNKMYMTYKELSDKFDIKEISIHRIIKGSIRKNIELEDLSKYMPTRQNLIMKDITNIITDLVHNERSIESVRKQYGYDYYTIKNLLSKYLSGNLELTSTTIESINVTPKENKVSA